VNSGKLGVVSLNCASSTSAASADPSGGEVHDQTMPLGRFADRPFRGGDRLRRARPKSQTLDDLGRGWQSARLGPWPSYRHDLDETPVEIRVQPPRSKGISSQWLEPLSERRAVREGDLAVTA